MLNHSYGGGITMTDYKKLYHKTYNAMTDVEKLIETAATILRIVQQECEEAYIKADNTPPEEDASKLL